MTTTTELIKQEEAQETGLVPSDMLTAISQAVMNPALDLDKMERLLAMHERITLEQRKTAFMAALARLTQKLPEIGKHGTSHHGKYARLVDIDRAIRPLIGQEGFALSFDTEAVDNKIRVICRLSHEGGHSETKQIDLPLDNSGSKNGAQSVISTVSYGRRALVTMFFNLTSAEEDTDGNNPDVITPEQVKSLEALITEAKADKQRFLVYMNVARIEDILVRDFKMAVTALESKRRSQK